VVHRRYPLAYANPRYHARDERINKAISRDAPTPVSLGAFKGLGIRRNLGVQ
jgi:hypothetical protein